ncbi:MULTISPECIES: hypothetical protein [unclassified Vibrio]|uniref:hypothetical protein n=1 Tax=unclassified Vibrio TaxID=2614977 RepID=UPI001361BE96|nr:MULTISPECIES: hypothetical protein [unclassified Vibrio]NAW60066.1 hypothetical protein [Vibrio sp. V36_P2S2PM302]NAX25977.1 hypothetical protein [Vibrio sp. V38_P2S17PM301]NAX30655.1 hypothetical protein [Vibrio sp. V37_P2S8PM304]
MLSKTEICNIALGRAQHTQRVANIDTENSLAAEMCRQYWKVSIESVLEGISPSFAQRIERLALLPNQINKQYDNVYILPDDCLAPLKVVTADYRASRKYNASHEIDFIKGQSDDGKNKTIQTDIDNAYLLYTTRNVDTHMFDPTFVTALTFLMGSNLANSVKKDTDLANQLAGTYMRLISKSAAIDKNAQSSEINYAYNFANPSLDERLN